MVENVIERKEKKQLKIDKRLSQIILPANKIDMFVNWWNTDIRFEKAIPHSFKEGYLIIDGYSQDVNVDDCCMHEIIKILAKHFHITYREVENEFKKFLQDLNLITLYFKFINDDGLLIEMYGGKGEILSSMQFVFGNETAEEREISREFLIENCKNFDDVMNKINYDMLGVFASCMWYIATTKNTTRYIYENKTPAITGRKKGVVQVSDTKYIKTPIYDMTKIRIVKADSLIARKKGWTYSHSFEVHGHYRHYQSGKVIFIEPFIKGKNKELKTQKIIIAPN